MSNMIVMNTSSLGQLKDVPASLKIAGLALLRAKSGRLELELPDGRRLLFDQGQPGPEALFRIHNYAVLNRTAAGGDIGAAESYMDGDWSTDDLTAVLEYFSENFEAAGRLAIGGALTRLTNMIRHMFNRNTRKGARRNILAHYDLGNAFYETWLDPSMTYSSAIFDSPNTSLEHGQEAKYAAIADALKLEKGSRVLEIGCGWGGFAEYAAKRRGAKVTCLTISDAQKAYAESRMARQDIADQVDIRLQDYRDHRGEYDAVASIEMFEAVGERYWPSYFGKIQSVLRAGGLAALQIITIRDDLFERYRKRADFIQRYIFPGGMLPSDAALQDQVRRAGLRYQGARLFGDDYARTLNLWRRRFNEAWDDIAQLGFDEPFKRLWNFYLAYCEAGFKAGRINVGQFSLAKP
ncbi:MAG: cyclopropane-fatty-acyl-phospholipid synthase family protein [Pseudomonadota bacterium]